jgi:hypothetical protein
MNMAGRNLVAHFTRSGNTRRIANLIQQEVGGTLHEIQPEMPYPSAYDAVVEQAKVEIQALCPQSTVLRSFEIYGSGRGNAQAKVSAWPSKLGVIR